VVLKLPILAAGVGFAAATAALWVQRWQREDHRVFAGLISISVTLTLFSGVAWGATEIAEGTPLSFTGISVGTLALLFAPRLYRQLQDPPSSEARRTAPVLSNPTKLSASGDEPALAFSSKLGQAGMSVRMNTSLSIAEDGGGRV
jgi:hypothetical protein